VARLSPSTARCSPRSHDIKAAHTDPRSGMRPRHISAILAKTFHRQRFGFPVSIEAHQHHSLLVDFPMCDIFFAALVERAASNKATALSWTYFQPHESLCSLFLNTMPPRSRLPFCSLLSTVPFSWFTPAFPAFPYPFSSIHLLLYL
jgi:hypothetical protein